MKHHRARKRRCTLSTHTKRKNLVCNAVTRSPCHAHGRSSTAPPLRIGSWGSSEAWRCIPQLLAVPLMTCMQSPRVGSSAAPHHTTPRPGRLLCQAAPFPVCSPQPLPEGQASQGPLRCSCTSGPSRLKAEKGAPAAAASPRTPPNPELFRSTQGRSQAGGAGHGEVWVAAPH